MTEILLITNHKQYLWPPTHLVCGDRNGSFGSLASLFWPSVTVDAMSSNIPFLFHEKGKVLIVEIQLVLTLTLSLIQTETPNLSKTQQLRQQLNSLHLVFLLL